MTIYIRWNKIKRKNSPSRPHNKEKSNRKNRKRNSLTVPFLLSQAASNHTNWCISIWMIKFTCSLIFVQYAPAHMKSEWVENVSVIKWMNWREKIFFCTYRTSTTAVGTATTTTSTAFSFTHYYWFCSYLFYEVTNG